MAEESTDVGQSGQVPQIHGLFCGLEPHHAHTHKLIALARPVWIMPVVSHGADDVVELRVMRLESHLHPVPKLSRQVACLLALERLGLCSLAGTFS